uniref:Actin-binding LIM protein 2 n=1 Tax=Mus musculus TaxID=10090 RepID=A0A0J9YUE1_MOUSE
MCAMRQVRPDVLRGRGDVPARLLHLASGMSTGSQD